VNFRRHPRDLSRPFASFVRSTNFQSLIKCLPLATGFAPLSFQSLAYCPRFATHSEALSFQPITYCPFCNPFVFKFLHVMGVGGCRASSTSGRFRPSDLPTCFLPIPLCFQTLPHSFALFCTRAKLNSFLFRRLRTLSQKTLGSGYSSRFRTHQPQLPCRPASSEAAHGDSYLPSSLSTALFRAGIRRRYTLLGSMPIDTQDEAAYLSAPMRSRMRLS
jgi:hypothetical protein